MSANVANMYIAKTDGDPEHKAQRKERETGRETVRIWVTLASHLSTADEY